MESNFIFQNFSLFWFKKEAIVDTKWFKKLGRVVLRKKQPKNKYKIIKQDLVKDKEWPFINKTTFE